MIEIVEELAKLSVQEILILQTVVLSMVIILFGGRR